MYWEHVISGPALQISNKDASNDHSRINCYNCVCIECMGCLLCLFFSFYTILVFTYTCMYTISLFCFIQPIIDGHVFLHWNEVYMNISGKLNFSWYIIIKSAGQNFISTADPFRTPSAVVMLERVFITLIFLYTIIVINIWQDRTISPK